MKIFSQQSIIISTFFLSILRIFTIPIDDYPDVFYVYGARLAKLLPGLDNILFFDELFSRYSCRMELPSNMVSKYLLGGSYKCTSFPMSFSYFFFCLLLTFLFISIIIYHLKTFRYLHIDQKIIFIRTIFFLVTIPSTLFFVLAIHTDVPYHFLTLSFVISFISLSLSNRLRIFPFTYLLAFFVLLLFIPDNQSNIFLGLIFVSISSYYLSKSNFIYSLFLKFSNQSNNILNSRFKLSKSTIILSSIIIILLAFVFKYNQNILTSFAGYSSSFISKVFAIYSESDLLHKYPLLFRIYGSLIGFIISTPFGFGVSFISTSLVFFSLVVGFLKFLSSNTNIFPLSLKIFLILSIIYFLICLSILPTFAYYKYWLFLSPLFCLLLSFNSRFSLYCICLVYFEYILRSPWVTLS